MGAQTMHPLTYVIFVLIVIILGGIQLTLSNMNTITCSQITENIPDVCSHYNDSTSE